MKLWLEVKQWIKESNHSPLGVASFCISLGGVLMIVVGILATVSPIDALLRDVDGLLDDYVCIVGMLLGFLLNVVGLGFGIAGRRQQGRNPRFAILGITVSTVIIIAVLALVCLVVLVNSTIH